MSIDCCKDHDLRLIKYSTFVMGSTKVENKVSKCFTCDANHKEQKCWNYNDRKLRLHTINIDGEIHTLVNN